jgi:hypothetical protein
VETSREQSAELPTGQTGREELPTARQSGQTYLIEDGDGFLMRVPEDRLEAWKAAQRERGDAPLSRSEQRLKDRILREIYGQKR